MNDNNIKVYNKFNRPDSKFIDSTSHFKKKYKLDSDGINLIEDGEIDLFEQIQSYRGLYDLKSIIRRYELGDDTALGVPGGSYTDNIGVSTDLRDYTQAAINQKIVSAYDSLSPDIRSKFTDIEDFRKSLGDGTFIDRLNGTAGTSPTGDSNNESNSEGDNKQ